MESGGETLVITLTESKIPKLLPHGIELGTIDLSEDSLTARYIIHYRRKFLRRNSNHRLAKNLENLAAIYVYDDLHLAMELSTKIFVAFDIDVLVVASEKQTEAHGFADYIVSRRPRNEIPLRKQLILTKDFIDLDSPLANAPQYIFEGGLSDLLRLAKRSTLENLVLYDKFFLAVASLLSGVPLCYWELRISKRNRVPVFLVDDPALEEMVYFWLTGKSGMANKESMRFFEHCVESALAIMRDPAYNSLILDLLNIRGQSYDKYFASPYSYTGWYSLLE